MDPYVITPAERARFEQQFNALKPINGIVTGEQAKGLLLQSQLPPAILGVIWALADTDADGKMNINEFSIACKLINLKLRGFELPKALPPALKSLVEPRNVDVYGSNEWFRQENNLTMDLEKLYSTLERARMKETNKNNPFICDTPPVFSTSNLSLQEEKLHSSFTNEVEQKMVQNITDSNSIMAQILQIWQSSAGMSNDPHFLYALNLSNELRKYDSQTVACVKRAIADILFEADTGRLLSYDANRQPGREDFPLSGISSMHNCEPEMASGHASPALSDTITQQPIPSSQSLKTGKEQQRQGSLHRRFSSAVSHF